MSRGRRRRKRGDTPLVEFRPGVFARLGESTRGSDGRRWFLATDDGRPRWFRADTPLDKPAAEDQPPPELRSLPCPRYRKEPRFCMTDPA